MDLLLRYVTVAVLCVVAFGVSSPALADWQLTDLGTPNGPWVSGAYGLNNAGQVVGSGGVPMPPPPAPPSAFYWESGMGMLDIGVLGGYSTSNAVGINSAGRVVGWGDDAVFLWDEATGFTEIDLGPGFLEVGALNNSDQVVGRASHHAYIWQAGMGRVDLGTFGGYSSVAHGINDAGQVVGAAEKPGSPVPLHAFVVTPENGVWYRDDDSDGINDLMSDLKTLPGHDISQAYDINVHGDIVGASYTFGVQDIRAFIYRHGEMQNLGTLDGDSSIAYAINQQRQVVGYSKTAAGVGHGFLWQNGVMVDLNDLLPPGTGWEIIMASDINDLGWIAGTGVGPNGEAHGILLIPEPAALALLLPGCLLLTARRFRVR
ncbi:MAG TPA: hypothetical protein PKK06_13260 [Phycisphaerae bacterium]|nr:hypothetical protein [Phycisphaerae bacterium]HNU45702.1 hypothetical protein [Phycisphaerae bacterium]